MCGKKTIKCRWQQQIRIIAKNTRFLPRGLTQSSIDNVRRALVKLTQNLTQFITSLLSFFSFFHVMIRETWFLWWSEEMSDCCFFSLSTCVTINRFTFFLFQLCSVAKNKLFSFWKLKEKEKFPSRKVFSLVSILLRKISPQFDRACYTFSANYFQIKRSRSDWIVNIFLIRFK